MSLKNYLNILALFVVIFLYVNTSKADIIDKLIQKTKQNHPTLKASIFYHEAAKAGLTGAFWQFFPTISVTAENIGLTPSENKPRGNETIFIIRAQQPIFTGGRIRGEYDKAKINEELAKVNVQVITQDLSIKLTQAYFEWYNSYLKIKAYERGLKLHNELKDMVLRRIKEGLSPQSDLTLVESRLQLIISELEIIRAFRLNTLEKIIQLVGESIDEKDLLVIPEIKNIENNPARLLQLAFELNPNLKNLVLKAELQKQEIELKKANLFPDIYLRAERQYGDFNQRTNRPVDRVYMIASSKFGSGLSTLSDIDAEVKKYNATLNEIDAYKRNLTELIFVYYNNLISSLSRKEFLNESLKNSELIFESWYRQFLAGKKSWIDLMNSARELVQVEVQLSDSISNSLLYNRLLHILTSKVD